MGLQDKYKRIEITLQLAVIIISLILCAVFQKAVVCILIGCIIILFILSAIFRRMNEKRVDKIIDYLMKVQNGFKLPDISKCNEGKLGILQSEIYKLVVLLNEQSEISTRDKDYLANMLSDISHQIKTPLTSMTIMTELLRDDNIPQDKRMEFVEKIDSQIDRITWLVRTLLTISQLDAGTLVLKQETVSIKNMLHEAFAPFEIIAELKDVAVNINASENIWIQCDNQWTREAFANIIKNCIEHTKTGGNIDINVIQNNFSTSIEIRDTGEGIASFDLPHIFERFYKGKNSSSSSVGIGLAMAKQIITMQNGRIFVESEEGIGTIFIIKLYSDVKI